MPIRPKKNKYGNMTKADLEGFARAILNPLGEISAIVTKIRKSADLDVEYWFDKDLKQIHVRIYDRSVYDYSSSTVIYFKKELR